MGQHSLSSSRIKEKLEYSCQPLIQLLLFTQVTNQMRELINQHSFMILATIILLLAAGVGLKMRNPLIQASLLIGLASLLLVIQLGLRTGPSTLNTNDELTKIMGNGTPTLIVVYSEY